MQSLPDTFLRPPLWVCEGMYVCVLSLGGWVGGWLGGRTQPPAWALSGLGAEGCAPDCGTSILLSSKSMGCRLWDGEEARPAFCNPLAATLNLQTSLNSIWDSFLTFICNSFISVDFQHTQFYATSLAINKNFFFNNFLFGLAKT